MSPHMTKEKKKGLGAFDFFSIGFGAIVGVGWAVALNNWMANSGGPVPAGLGYLLSLVMMAPIALCYCELAPMLPVAGGGAAYAYKAFGEKVSMLSGWAAFGAFVTIIPWEAIYVTDVLSYMFPALRLGDAIYTLAGTDIYLGSILVGAVFSTLLFLMNVRGIGLSTQVQKVLCVILVGSGILAMISAVAGGSAENLQPYYENVTGTANHHSFATGVFSMVVTAAWFLCGFETIPQAIEEAEGDVKSAGKTVVLSVVLACLFYAAILFCLGTAMPWKDFYLLGSPAAANLFLVEYAGNPWGTVMYIVILVGCLAGLFTTWNGFMMASPRLLMSLARTHMVPFALAKQNKNGTPINSLIICYILSLIGPFLGLGLIDPLTSFSAAGFLVSWLITSLCVIRLRKTAPDLPRPYKIPGGSATAGFAAIVTGIVLVMCFIPGTPCYLGSLAITLFVVWMLLGLILYLGNRKARKQIPKEERVASLFQKMSK